MISNHNQQLVSKRPTSLGRALSVRQGHEEGRGLDLPLKKVRRVEFLQRSEVRSGIGAHIVEQITSLDRVFTWTAARIRRQNEKNNPGKWSTSTFIG